VTNVIGVLSKGDVLTRWSAKMVAEQAWELRNSLNSLGRDEAIDILKSSPWRSSRRASDRGTSIHEYLDARLRGLPGPTLEGQAAGYQPAADAFLAELQPELVESEVTVFGDGYAGTFDAHLRIHVDGHREDWLVDFKTGKGGPYDEAALQLAALSRAQARADGSATWAGWDRLVAVGLSEKGYRLVEVADPEGCYLAFRALLEAWHWKHNGAALTEVEL